MTAFDTVREVGETARMPNRLTNATSPYLLQHAHNPVDWYEWGPEALARAASEQKPILLSIGYAACHWCHVMERESFEDHETAAFMNDHFVCVKVDREERPDLDAIYMDAVQAMTGHGGWPMTMFCTPDGLPFYGGTYFPPDDRHGLPSFRRVLMGVAEAWRSQRDQAIEQGGTLLSHIMQRTEGLATGTTAIDTTLLRTAFDAMRAGFDDEWGGFGGAPKFPQPMTLEFLMRCVRMEFDGAATMLATTLSKMARGGVYDQIGGGFHRYAVDRIWLVPHFEKMLYDNGQLLRLYARAAVMPALSADHGLFRAVAVETGEYLLREMRHASGGFFSSQDADAEGVEGKFHVWAYDQFMRVAGDDGAAAAAFYAVTPEGNWEGSAIPWIPRDPADVAADLGMSVDAVHAAVERARAALFAARSTRIRPATDDKILAAWNGLAISGLSQAGRLLDRPDFVDAAVAAADFVMSALRRDDGRLLRSWRDGRTSGPGYLDDYALMGGALLDVYETTFDERHAGAALELARDMRVLFADDEGGFYDTGSDAEALVLRPRDVFDNAVPSGNAAAANLLLRLSALTGDGDLDDAARATLARIAPITARAPLAFGEALTAMDAIVAGIKEVAVAGDPDAAATRALARQVWLRPWVPHVLAVAQPGESAVPLMSHRSTRDGAPAAYVCEHFTCKEPVTGPDELANQLDG